MSAPAKIFAIMIGGLILILLVMAYLGASLPAAAHSFYTGTRDPVYAQAPDNPSQTYRMPDYWYAKERDPVYSDVSCCHNDCGVIPDEWVTELGDGYQIRMTEAQARTINRAWNSGPVDAFVPMNRLQNSPDGRVHVCLMTYPSKVFGNGKPDPRGGVRCVWGRVGGS